jgi:ubiquinone/menaquinone biosynthesis C-methylase UbiE
MQGGYRDVVRSVVDAAQPRRGERIVEIGCGPGAVVRWLAHHLTLDNPIAGVDVNSFLLREAAALTNASKFAGHITFHEADAEALPFEAGSFDITLSFTVMEEVDADRMLAEMVRVTKSGGRIGVVVRATDMPRFLNISLPAELRSKVLAMSPPYLGAVERGCGDASLYRRFVEAGLKDLQMGPQLAPEQPQRSVERMQQFVDRIAQALPADEAGQFQEAVRRAVESGSLIYAEPYHCVVGVKR